MVYVWSQFLESRGMHARHKVEEYIDIYDEFWTRRFTAPYGSSEFTVPGSRSSIFLSFRSIDPNRYNEQFNGFSHSIFSIFITLQPKNRVSGSCAVNNGPSIKLVLLAVVPTTQNWGILSTTCFFFECLPTLKFFSKGDEIIYEKIPNELISMYELWLVY